MKNRPVHSTPALSADSPVPAPGSVPDSGSVPAIPSGYKTGTVGLLVLEGEEPRPALVFEKSLVGVKFQMWCETPEGGYITVDVPWRQIRQFWQKMPMKKGEKALLEMCVEHMFGKSICYANDLVDNERGRSRYRLVAAYHYNMTTPGDVVDDLYAHAFPNMVRLGLPSQNDAFSRQQVRRLCTAPNAIYAREMMKRMVQLDLTTWQGRNLFFEIWVANAPALRGQRDKIAEAIARNFTWDEIRHFLYEYKYADTFVSWSDTWMHAAAKMISKQTDTDKELDWKARLIQTLRTSQICATREEWLRLPSLDKLARLWNRTAEGFLDQYILDQ